MLRIWMMLAAVVMWAGAAQAQDSAEIEDVITQQLNAFVERDVEGAWQFASPMIQRMFRTPGNFGRMVEEGYPMVWDNRDAEFMENDGADGLIQQKVFIRDTEGNGWLLLYAMIETADGWRINGVQVVPAPELAA